MTGIVGGAVTGSSLKAATRALPTEPWYERQRLEAGSLGIGVATHGQRDPTGTTSWNDGSRIGVLHGTITNRDALGWSVAELFGRLLERPEASLAQLDGPFVIVAADAGRDRLVLGTDKLGTRRCYYSTAGRFVFGTDVGALLAHLPEPALDDRALTDLLTIGQVWGGRTLVSAVKSMPSGGVLVYRGAAGTTTVDRYWEQRFDRSAVPPSGAELADAYRRVVGACSATIDPDREVGVWLSGGLDSRSLAAALAPHHDITTFTYDANPPTGDNLRLARRVADALGMPNEQVALTPDGFASVLADGVDLVDGMVPWATFLNLTAAFELASPVDVLFEGSGQGGLLGNDVWRADLERAQSPSEALYRSQHYVDRTVSDAVLSLDVDPMRTYEEETAASPADDFDGAVLQAYHRNFYPYGEFASNAVARRRAGTRVPFADREFLRLVSRIPRRFRTDAVPLTGGKVPYGTARLKLELVRELNDGLDRIPYERTGVAPARPRWLHAAGFVLTTGLARLRSQPTYGGRTLAGEWYRHHDGLRRLVDGLLDDVCERAWVNDGTVRQLQARHHDGTGDYVRPLACLSTVEQWLQTHL